MMKNNITNFENFKLNESVNMSRYNELQKFAEKLDSKVELCFAKLVLNKEVDYKVTVLYNFEDSQYIITEKLKTVNAKDFDIDNLENNHVVRTAYSENVALNNIKLFAAFFHENYCISDLAESDLFDNLSKIIDSYNYRDSKFEDLLPLFQKTVKDWEVDSDSQVKSSILKGLGFSDIKIISRNIGL